MDEGKFWAMISLADRPAELHGFLRRLPPDELLGFERMHTAYMDRAYDWGIWGAAYLIGHGCADDTFECFRALLISLGREIYTRALADPDSLADVEIPDENDWEDWTSPTAQVIQARTGVWEFAGAPDPDRVAPTDPSGTEWDDEDLVGRFPRLAARYE